MNCIQFHGGFAQYGVTDAQSETVQPRGAIGPPRDARRCRPVGIYEPDLATVLDDAEFGAEIEGNRSARLRVSAAEYGLC